MKDKLEYAFGCVLQIDLWRCPYQPRAADGLYPQAEAIELGADLLGAESNQGWA